MQKVRTSYLTLTQRKTFIAKNIYGNQNGITFFSTNSTQYSFLKPTKNEIWKSTSFFLSSFPKNFQFKYYFSEEKKPEDSEPESNFDFQESLIKLSFSIESSSSEPLKPKVENLPKERKSTTLNKDIIEQQGKLNAAQILQVLQENLTPSQISEKFGISDKLISRGMKYVNISSTAVPTKKE